MAKRSDFAQKLLDDLRLRKERLGTPQNSSHSRTQTQDAYGYSKQTYRGSAGHGKAAIRTTNTQSRCIGGPKSVSREQSSNQIVPFQKSQGGSQHIGDFSMALAFALQNGGKLRRVDSSGNNNNNPILTFLHQIGGGAVDFSKMRRSSTSRVPTLTHLHIKEISRGAQKLNQILRTCSNGLNFDQHFGKELLKGAMDLQESLRMLVDLQEASDVMVTPQRKNHRIVLLEEDDEEDDESVDQQKQLDLPRFSFDKPRRHFHDSYEPRASQKQWLSTLKQNNVSVSVSSSQPKAEKGRISNVIAKLMGLEEAVEEKTPKKSKDAIILKLPTAKGNGTKPDKNLVTRDAVRGLTVHKNVDADMIKKPPRKSPEKMDQRLQENGRGIKEAKRSIYKEENHQVARSVPEKAYFKERKVPMGKRTQEKPLCIPQKGDAVEERKQQMARQKKGNEMASKALSKPNTQKKHSPVVAQLKPNRYSDAKVVPVKQTKKPSDEKDKSIKTLAFLGGSRVGPKKTHGTAAEANPVPQSTTSEEVKKVGNDGEASAATSSMETEKNMKLSQNMVKEVVATTYGLVTSAPKLVHQDMDERQILASDNSGQRNSSPVTNDLHSQASGFGTDNEPQSAKVIPTGTMPEIGNLTSDFQPEKRDMTMSKIQHPLTESEGRFKCILMESRLFLDTARALFKFNITAEVFSVCSQDFHEDDSKLMLDCGYEIMRRKGRLQEMTFHPFMTMHFSLMEAVTFDDLVKKLSDDFDKLKLYGRNGTQNCEVEEYLPRMLEYDVHVRDPEINSMWDLGWNDPMFAFIENDEVVKDVERQLLAGLIEETTRDLLHILQHKKQENLLML